MCPVRSVTYVSGRSPRFTPISSFLSCRRALRVCLRGRTGAEVHFWSLARAFGGSEISVVSLEACPSGEETVREDLQVGVVVLQSVVVTLTLGRDTIFGSSEFVLQAKEFFVRLQLRVILGDYEQAAEGSIELVVGGNLFLRRA